MKNAKRIEARTGKGGWTTLTFKDGDSSSSNTLATHKLRTGPNVLVEAAEMAKEAGAEGVSWGACSSKYWVGRIF